MHFLRSSVVKQLTVYLCSVSIKPEKQRYCTKSNWVKLLSPFRQLVSANIPLVDLLLFFFSSGFNVETVQSARGISFEVWDAGGAEKYRRLVRYYFQNCQGFFFVVDSSDRDRFHEARDVLFKIIGDEFMVSVPFVVIANKSDLPTAAKPAEIIEQLNLHSISKRLWCFQSASAITDEGIHETIRQLTQMIKKNGARGIS